MNLFAPKVTNQDIAVFLENMSFLLKCGYNSYDAVAQINENTKGKKHDKEATRVRIVCTALMKDLSEGFALSSAMLRNEKYFRNYAKQVEAAEASDQVSEVLDQIVANIRDSGDLKHKLKSAMIYPVMVLVITFGVAWYLFTFVIPDILEMLVDVGSGEIPPMTQVIMNLTDWLEIYSVPLIIFLLIILAVTVFLAKGPFKMSFHSAYTRIPIISKITLASNICTWLQSMKFMLAAGSPIAMALSSASDAMSNIYMQKQAHNSYYLFATSGIPVSDALKECKFLSAMEMSTINIGLESGQIVEVLDRLSKRRKEDSDKAIAGFIAALNPLIICVLGVVVGVIVLAVYGPLMNITSIIA